MARDAVWKLLSADTALAALAGNGFVVLPQYEAEQRPDAEGFIVICWRHVDFDEDVQENAERHFDIYAHSPISVSATGNRGSNDFGRLDNMLDRCDEIFKAVADATDPVVGDDGWQLNFVVFEGRGMDITDEDYQTISKQASYAALACKVTAP